MKQSSAATDLPRSTANTDRWTDSNTSPGPFMARFVLSAMMAATGPEGCLPFGTSRFREAQGAIAQSSTLLDEKLNPALTRQIRRLFDEGAHEFFRDGMESNFSRSLLMLLREHGQGAVAAIAEYLFSGNAKPDVASEALRWMSDIDDRSTFSKRWQVFRKSLMDKSPRVRDGAILAFANMNDPRALNVLADAKTIEPIAELRSLIDQVIAQLERTK